MEGKLKKIKMIKALKAAVCLVLVMGGLIACGKTEFEADEDTVYVTKSGVVKGASIGAFDAAYYDEVELKDYITQTIVDYVENNGDGTIAMNKFMIGEEEAGKKAKLYLDYESGYDYEKFNEVTFFAGTVLEAQAAEYAFDEAFRSVEDGEIKAAADAKEVMEQTEYKAVVIGQEINVRVDGKIMYVSDGNVEVTGKNTAKAHYDLEAESPQLCYIIYK